MAQNGLFRVTFPYFWVVMKVNWAQAEKNLSDREWRMNNLYRIITDKSEEIDFTLNSPQKKLCDNAWYWNLLLKARQLGFTTWIDLFILDACLFNNNIQAGIIAHDLKSAQRIFYQKIKFPYEHLHSELKSRIPATKCDAMELRLANGSSIWVGVTMRSATLRMLHVSELGKICAKFPEKAREIQTGALPTLHEGSWLFVESTAEGAAGLFYDMAMDSQTVTTNADRAGKKLNKQQMRFHFFPWFEHPTNLTNTEGISVSDDLKRYFDELEGKLDIKLNPERRAWYALKRDGPGGLGKYMKRENPSTPQEAFEQSVEGAVYGDEIEQARNEGRIGFYPWIKTAPVYTFWDLGYGDATVVVFAQFIQDQIRIIDYYTQTGRGAAYHSAQVKSKEYIYADHFGPHDVMNHEKGSGIVLKDTYDTLLGMSMRVVERPRLKADGIDAVRSIFNKLVFNERTTRELCKALSFYRYEWDEDAVCYKKDPVHDGASHSADAMQALAMQYRYSTIDGKLLGWPHPIPANVGVASQNYDRLRIGIM